MNSFVYYIEIIFSILFLIIVAWYIHDKYVQRRHQLLANYPIIGRLRYLFEEVREPFRQYFGDEKFYESKDKLDWVQQAARNQPAYGSFSPSQPLKLPKFMLKHTNIVLNEDEVSSDFSVIFGENRKKPFTTSSIIARSAMSDGSISPEGTRAFTSGAYSAHFPINTGEGSLTSNFLFTHKKYSEDYMEIYKGNKMQIMGKKLVHFLFNGDMASKFYIWSVVGNRKDYETFTYDNETLRIHRVNWDSPLENFPKEVPSDIPDIIYQISSGLYGCRDSEGKFDPLKYQKKMAFCKMTEIKIAQGAKQTGGKLIGEKVTEAVAYYRGIEPYKNAFSPNRFPYANSVEELFDFIGQLQELSDKPVGIKIVISDYSNIVPIAEELHKRVIKGDNRYPDFITVDSGFGGSATAPIETMERIGLDLNDSIYLVDKVLKEYGVRDKVKLVGAGKILTPDDVIIALSLGADFLQIARGFMMSAGCIRARHCSGVGGRQCPVGLATQDKSKRKNYFVYKQAAKIDNYHKNLLKGTQSLMAVMGVHHYKELNKKNLMFIDSNSKVHDNIDKVFERILDIKEH